MTITHADGGAGWEEARACGVVRLYDRVAADRVHLLYAGYYPAADPSPDELRRQLDNPTFAHRRRRLESVLPEARRRILEIGCGDGNFLAYLRGHGWTVQGSEYDAETAALVLRRHGIHVAVGDVADARPPGAPFPAVAAYHVLEHVYRPAEWLAVVRGMIELGGILHLQVPNFASLTRRATGMAWASLMHPQHVYFYSPATLCELLERAGFEPLRVTTWDPWHGPGTVSASVVNQMRRAAGGGLPWTDAIGGEGSAASSPAPPAPPARRSRLARRVLDRLAASFARAEALLGAGAVVDVVARVR